MRVLVDGGGLAAAPVSPTATNRRVAASAPKEAGRSLAKARILLVEDEPFIRDLLSEVLQEADLDVSEASNGEEAVDLLQRDAGFDLLLTDVHMPGRFDGIAVARQARARRPELLVVFATGRPETLHTFGPLGPRDVCLFKPFSPSEVLRLVERLLGSGAP
jgi:CheY-like chemotaxis protein